jgi:hypothetical protein
LTWLVYHPPTPPPQKKREDSQILRETIKPKT